MSLTAAQRLALVALSTLAACGGARPLGSPPPNETGAAGSVAPLPMTGGGGTGGDAGTGGAAAGTGGAAAGTGGAAAGTSDAGTGGAIAGSGGTAGNGGSAGAAGRSILVAQTIPDFDPVAISASGMVVAGVQKNFAVRWTPTTGVTRLPFVGPVVSSTVTAMDREGMVLVGSLLTQTSQAVAWAGTVNLLGFARAGDDRSEAVACSGDGKAIVGTSESSSRPVRAQRQAFLWRVGPGIAPVPFLTGDVDSQALAISQDGSTVIGFSFDTTPDWPRRRAFWWREGAAPVEIAPPPGATSMVPRALSADGVVVVGDAQFDAGTRAFRWTPAGGVELAAERGDRDQSRAVGVSNDGGTITGLAFTNGQWKDLPIPFRWQPPSPTLLTAPPDDLPVPDIFTDELGTTIVGLGQIYVTSTAFLWRPGSQGYRSLSLGPLPINSAGVALSRNGSVLLGKGITTAAEVDAWLLQLP